MIKNREYTRLVYIQNMIKFKRTSTPYKGLAMNRQLRINALALVASIGGFLFGFDTAVISGAVIRLQETLLLSAAGLGFVVSSALIGCVLGSYLAGFSADHYGRKKTLQLSAFLFLSSAIGCYLVSDTVPLILVRFIGGLGVGLAAMAAPLYIAEISPAAVRGRLVSLWQFSITIGILSAYLSNLGFADIAGKKMWQIMFGVEAIPAMLFLLLLLLVPESPRWLWQKNPEEALKLMMNLLGAEEGREEISKIKPQKKGESLFSFGFPILCAVVLVLGSQFSGINAVIYYGPTIFKEAGLESGQWFTGTVILGVINMLATIPAIFLVDKIGRKPLLLWGATGAFISLLGSSFCMNGWRPELLIVFIGVYLACFAFSLGPISWVVISEIFPVTIRGKALSFSTLILWIATAFIAQTFPMLNEGIGAANTFLFYAVCLLPVIGFIIWILPETKGKSVEDELTDRSKYQSYRPSSI